MNKKFLVIGEEIYSYVQLINDLNSKFEYSHYIYVKENHPYKVFLNILHSFLYDYPIVMIDGDFSEEELTTLDLTIEEMQSRIIVSKSMEIKSLQEVINRINSNKYWSITIFTSGTTGVPKKVTHSFETIARNIKTGEKFKNNVWGFAYNPTHMAGLQVFLQAIINENTIVYLFGKAIATAKIRINNDKVTNISATSSYYRNLLMQIQNEVFKSVKYITFGGEKVDEKIIDDIQTAFPNAKIRNIYALTEAGSLFNSNGDTFSIPNNIRNLVKISDENELLIHENLLGTSDTYNLKNGWYNTKDIIEIIDENNFKFISRKSEIINVGGYNVNPHEIEELLLHMDEIVDVRAYARKNRITGSIIVVDVVLKDKYKEKHKDIKQKIREYAKEHLQPWKVPRMINCIENITQSRTGKKMRI